MVFLLAHSGRHAPSVRASTPVIFFLDIDPPTQIQDVIVNGDLEEEPAPTSGETSAPPAPKTAKQLAAKRNQERAAIKSRFGGNEESKKMQKNVLKHQFENFATASNESLDKAYDRSLPSSWNQIALIMRNKPGIDEIDIDDLYNNLRVYEDEMKNTAGGTSQVPSTPCAHDVAYSFFAQPTTSPQLENEDF
ncbi:hypothetical protein Tco_0901791 [Tanacetum coccineum]